MKLATLRNGSRNGRLVVVSRDLTRCTSAELIAPSLQAALDDWDHLAPRLADLAEGLEHGAVPEERFHERAAESPLPRAYQWLDGSAYENHFKLLRRARGEDPPATLRTDPMMYQGSSDTFLGPRDPIPLADPEWGCDFEAEVAVVIGDVPQGADRATALGAVRLVMLANDVSLRKLAPAELAKGFGFLHAKPASAFSPVAVTPDELGDAWRDGKLHLPLLSFVDGVPFGRPNAGVGVMFDFGQQIAHAARTRRLAAGTIVGGGTVSNGGGEGGFGSAIKDGGAGYSCIAEHRAMEKLLSGASTTPFLGYGHVVRIEMKDESGHSIFGAIEQKVERYEQQGIRVDG